MDNFTKLKIKDMGHFSRLWEIKIIDYFADLGKIEIMGYFYRLEANQNDMYY